LGAHCGKFRLEASSSLAPTLCSRTRLCGILSVFLLQKFCIYDTEMWVTTKRDMTRLEAAEMRFLRSVTGYTGLDKIISETVRKELEISGIQDMRTKYRQNWINHLERMDNNRLPKHALNYKPRRRRDRERPRKRWPRVDAGTGQTT